MSEDQLNLINEHKFHPGFQNMVIQTLKDGPLMMTKLEAMIQVSEYLENCKVYR